MIGVKDKIRLMPQGLFAKYVIALVGLVVFVLAVNGAFETWISYRATKTTLTDAMSEKAEATAKRIETSISDLERQISWVTRASAVSLEQHRADYAQLLAGVPAVSQLSLLNGNGHELLRLTRTTILLTAAPISPAICASPKPSPTASITRRPNSTARSPSCRSRCRIPVSTPASPSPTSTCASCRISSATPRSARPPSPMWWIPAARCWRPRPGPEIGADLSALPQVAALMTPGHRRWLPAPTTTAIRCCSGEHGAETRLERVLRAADRAGAGADPGSAAADRASDRARPRGRDPGRHSAGAAHADPGHRAACGARRLGAGDFNHRIDVHTADELEELASQFNSMAGQLAETYSGLEAKVEERTRDLAQSINELKVLEEVGRAVSSSLDLNAVLPTVAARALEITHADAVLIYGYDRAQPVRPRQSIGIDKTAEGEHLAVDQGKSLLGEAASKGEPIAIPDLAVTADHVLRDLAIAAGFHSVLVVPLVDQKGVLGSLVVLRRNTGEFSPNLIGLMRTFAHQSVLAMRNARLFTEVDQKGRELATAHSTVRQQADKLQQQTDQLKDWNKSLEQRVETQLGEIERIRRLERFLAPQVAQLIASGDGHEGLLDSHRREVTVVFCDLRGFTAFTESTEPEEAMNVLREYHAALGELIFRYEGTLDRYAGDGVMILFNAPIQFEDHVKRAVKMSVEMRDTIGALTEKWRNRGHNLGFGIGIALGYATLGQIGFEQRLEYAAIGSVTNLASRLCDEAKANQIVVGRRVYGMVEPWVVGRPIDDLNLKGFNHPVLAAEILSWREEVDNVVDAAPAARRRKQPS